ncbi:MAG: hypothetical protein WCG04_03420 [Alphaproteobacteria bacterium]
MGLDAAQAVADTWDQIALQALTIAGGHTQPLENFLNWVRHRDNA